VAQSVDDYLASVSPPEFRRALERLREVIRDEAPEAKESISYGMPAYNLHGPLVYFGAFKNHCSLFGAHTVGRFAPELVGHKTSKGTIQFTPDNPLPEDLVRRLVRARIEENRDKKGLA
jgi:uncharacterized protein YdhG (YjbR/CyaY superfamily)